MSRKRRMFDIDLPEDAPVPEVAEATFPAGKSASEAARRGPMAEAIADAARSGRDRARIEAEIRAENDALAHELVRLKRAGLVTDLVALDEIDTEKLVRDRQPGPDAELAELVGSIRDIGLSNPIMLEPTGQGRYELIQGFRRLAAYRQLLDESGDVDRWGRIPAAIAARGDAIEQLYRRMVDENMVRKGVSFAEMARLALHYARDPATGEGDPEKAVAILFKSAGYQKRSYIRAFIPLVATLESDLMFAEAIPRALGLSLAQRLNEAPELAEAIRSELAEWDGRSAEDELAVLRRHVGRETAGQGGPAPEAPPTSRMRTIFHLSRPEGRARCTAANGRLEIRLARDFTALDRKRLERAVAALLDNLE